MNELKAGVEAYVAGQDLLGTNKVFAHPLPFNLIPHIDVFQENGYTKEEMKVLSSEIENKNRTLTHVTSDAD